eukprot:768127-Hanusia_phi.AAC.5
MGGGEVGRWMEQVAGREEKSDKGRRNERRVNHRHFLLHLNQVLVHPNDSKNLQSPAASQYHPSVLRLQSSYLPSVDPSALAPPNPAQGTSE